MLSKITFFKKSKTNSKIRTEQGFTLVESLMGIVVISVVAVVITPPIVISTATRVQNRRAEQAMQLAQAEVDRIRVFVEQGGDYSAKLPPILTGTIANGNVAAVAAPTSFVATRTLADVSTEAFGVDVDNDSQIDYYVQTFRDNDTNVIVAGTLVAFQMGVRVYSKVAKVDSLQTPPQPASLQFTTSSGSQQFRPLAVVYTTIARSDARISLDKYRQYLSSPSPSP